VGPQNFKENADFTAFSFFILISCLIGRPQNPYKTIFPLFDFIKIGGWLLVDLMK